jgi:nitrogen fixation protein FixH
MEMNSTSSKKSRWGIGIFALYGGFVVFILICVAFASLQSFDLVESDYYQKGLDYQQRIDRVNRTATSGGSPGFGYDAAQNAIVISFPASISAESLGGVVTLFRPSNAQWDRTIPLRLASDNRQIISAEALAKGRWRIKIDWSVGDTAYYAEDFFDLE